MVLSNDVPSCTVSEITPLVYDFTAYMTDNNNEQTENGRHFSHEFTTITRRSVVAEKPHDALDRLETLCDD